MTEEQEKDDQSIEIDGGERTNSELEDDDAPAHSFKSGICFYLHLFLFISVLYFFSS